ncbi:MAG TPA: LD-carboxypeptidase [Gemmatimonadaceae bacterium]|jgi:muramoyltetrapeptide carboxypeptidase
MQSRRFPTPLSAGARIGLVSPSGPLRDATDLEQAIANVRVFGWEPVVGNYVLERDGYLAGSDEQRVADLNRFARDESIDAIWCLRGGYGAMRLLDAIDYDALAKRPRAIIGYSDITALHAAIGQCANMITFHGPTARGELTTLTRDSFARALSPTNDSKMLARGGMTTLAGGSATGRLVGGNLALVSGLVGTPYAWELDGAILVLEDVSEQVYRLDRMLTQLRLTGALARVAGIAFGNFTDIPEDATNVDRSLDRVLREIAESTGVPCVMNFPIGHLPDHVTLPLGAIAELNADNGGSLIVQDWP